MARALWPGPACQVAETEYRVTLAGELQVNSCLYWVDQLTPASCTRTKSLTFTNRNIYSFFHIFSLFKCQYLFFDIPICPCIFSKLIIIIGCQSSICNNLHRLATVCIFAMFFLTRQKKVIQTNKV